MLLGHLNAPTLATGDAVGICIQPVPVVIAGSLVSTLEDHDGRPPMTPPSLDLYRY